MGGRDEDVADEGMAGEKGTDEKGDGEMTCNPKHFTHCKRCGEKFLDGITIWRVSDGWIHPECATDDDKRLMKVRP